MVGAPSYASATLNLLSDGDGSAVVAYGPEPHALRFRSVMTTLAAGAPKEFTIEGLSPDTRYYYRLADASTDATLDVGTFTTQRSAGSTFTFTITADPHLDQSTDTTLYARTLGNVAADAPDFHFDLGDTFMTEKLPDRLAAAAQYRAQRSFFSAMDAPLFLAVGNHDGEYGRVNDGSAESTAVWSNLMRERYFANPAPGGIYSGNEALDPYAGHLRDYYAWEWGDALFVVLDPYWYSGAPTEDGWGYTLGVEQYRWLSATLAGSDATYKFVFVHQLVGGATRAGRGGVEAAAFGEWGGKNVDGTDGFEAHRPGWGVPIHQLLVDNRVTAVYHGHDHLYAKQDLDGIVYQEVPQPACTVPGNPATWAEYGYTQGTLLGSSGHLRVTVGPQGVVTAYVRAFLPASETRGHANREVAHSYTIAAP